MPEHDLLLQLNKDIKEVCRAVGRIEQKVDAVKETTQVNCDDYEALEGRVRSLEKKDIYRAGFAGGIALIVSLFVGWL